MILVEPVETRKPASGSECGCPGLLLPSRFDKIHSMETVTLQDLERDPGGFLDRVEAGERLVISRGGRPVAELRPLASSDAGARPFGLAAGSFTVPADFDSPLPDDVLKVFEGR